MSLTSHLDDKQSPVREFLYTQFLHTRRALASCRQPLANATTIRPAIPDAGYPWSTIGMALDYRIRYYFEVSPVTHLTAYRGVQGIPIPLHHPDREFWEAILPMVWGAVFASYFAQLKSDLQLIQPVGRRLARPEEELLARHCVLLALCEELYRAPVRDTPLLASLYRAWVEHESLFLSFCEAWAKDTPLSATIHQLSSTDYEPLLIPEIQPIVSRLLGIAQPHWIDDLCALSWQFHDKQDDIFSQAAILNPEFEGSIDVNGADADLIVNYCLIDIKTTVKQQVKGEWLYQLLGYTLLDYSDRYRLKEVAIYMARQGVLLRWPLDQLLSAMSSDTALTLGKLRSQFKRITKKGHGNK